MVQHDDAVLKGERLCITAWAHQLNDIPVVSILVNCTYREHCSRPYWQLQNVALPASIAAALPETMFSILTRDLTESVLRQLHAAIADAAKKGLVCLARIPPSIAILRIIHSRPSYDQHMYDHCLNVNLVVVGCRGSGRQVHWQAAAASWDLAGTMCATLPLRSSPMLCISSHMPDLPQLLASLVLLAQGVLRLRGESACSQSLLVLMLVSSTAAYELHVSAQKVVD